MRPLIISHRTQFHFAFHWMHRVNHCKIYNSSFARHVSLIHDLTLTGVSSPFFRSLIYSYRVSPNRSCLYNLPGYPGSLVLTLKASSTHSHKEERNRRGNNKANSNQHPLRQLPVYADESTFRLPDSNGRLP